MTTRKIKVLHVYRTYFPDTQGGLEETIRQICVSTNHQGVDSRVFTLSPDPDPASINRPECTVYRAKKHLELASCSISFTAGKIFRQQSDWADLIHYHFPWPFADYLFFSNPKKPSIVTYHSDIIRQRLLRTFYKPLQNRFLDSVDRIVCTSPNYFATSDVLAQFSHKVSVVPIGITESSYDYEPSADHLAEVEQQYGRDFFLFVGVLRYYKGLHILLDAAKGAAFKVIIVGSGPIEEELKKQALALRVDNVVFAGYLDDKTKVALFKLSRGIVFPSYLRSEAFGLTLLEGAMYGRPLISTEVGSGTSHVNIDDETGLVIPPGAAKPLRRAMDRLHFRPEMARAMGKRARIRFEKLFNGDLMGKRYVTVYKKTLMRSSQPTKQPHIATER